MAMFILQKMIRTGILTKKTTTIKTRLIVADPALIALELPLLHFFDLAGHLLNPHTYHNKQIKMMESIEHS